MLLFIKSLGRWGIEPERPVADYENGWNRAKTFHEVVFVTVESGLVLAALWLGFEATRSLLLLALYAAAYFALGVYLLNGAKLATASFIDAKKMTGSRRTAARVIGTLGWVIALGLPYALTGLVNEAIALTIQQR